MPRNSGGTYSLPAGNPVVTGASVSSTVHNNTLNDITSEMTDSLSRSNKGAMLAQLQLFAGTVGVPGLAFGSDTDMGFYYSAAGITKFSVAGVELLELAANKLKIGGTAPAFQWNESDAAADNKLWNAIATGEEFKLQVLTDALTATDFMTVTRTAGVVDNINLVATAVQANGSAVATAATVLSLTGGTLTGALTIGAAEPLFFLNETDAAANNRLWSIRATSEAFALSVWNDAIDTTAAFFSANRTANTVDDVNILATTINFVGALVGSSTMSLGGALTLSSTIPRIIFTETDAGTDEKSWEFRASGGDFFLYTDTDAGSASGTPLTITRTGTVVDAITFAATDIVVSGNLQLGNATDTTLARIAAGRVSIEGLEIGYKHIPQNSQANSYTAVLADSGKHLYRASGSAAAQTWTIPSNASVAYDVGTVLTFVNMSANSVSIAITTDTMNLAGAGTTGTRTLAQYGVATAVKIASTLWIISGTNLS